MKNIIETLVNLNDNIKEKDIVIEELKYLDAIMSEESKTNFYNNILSVQIDLNLRGDSKDITSFTRNDFYKRSANYSAKDNKITISENQIKKLKELSKIKKDPYFFEKSIREILLHELAHMASTSYNEKDEKTKSGFSNFSENVNHGLTEGLTCFIAASRYPNVDHKLISYFPELCLIGQLEKIMGIEVMLDSYFNNKGTYYLEQELVKLGLPEKEADMIFRNIEKSFEINSLFNENNIYNDIQENLIDIYNIKILNSENRLEDLKNFQAWMLTEEDLNIPKEKRNITNLRMSTNKIEWLKIQELEIENELV